MRIVCAHIEGLGKIDGTGESSGYLFTTELPSGFDRTTSSYDWRPVMPQDPQAGETRVEPFEPVFRFSPFDLTLSAGRAQDFIAELMLFKQVNAITEVNETAFSSSDPTLTVDSATGLSVGDVIYINAETLKITGISGNDLTVTRGHYGSEGAAHPEGANVFTRPPLFEGRRVTLYTYDTERGSLEPRQRGIISGSVTMDGATMTVPVRQLMAPVTKAKINRDPVRATNSDLQEYTVPEDFDVFPSEKYFAGTISVDSGEDFTRVKKTDGQNASGTFWEINGEPYLASGNTLTYRLFKSGVRELNDVPRTGGNAAKLESPPTELFVVSRLLDEQFDDNFSSTADYANMSSSFTVGGTSFDRTQEQKNHYIYHPLAIFAAWAFGTSRGTSDPEEFDILKAPNMALDLSFLFAADVKAKIHELVVDALGRSQQIDQIVIGAGGKPERMLDVARKKLLHPYGYKLGATNEGKLTIYRPGPPDVDGYSSARGNQISPIGGADGVYVVDNGQGSTVDVIEAEFGATPYNDGRLITLKADSGLPDRTFSLHAQPETSLDLSTLDASEGVREATRYVLNQALLQHFASKRLRVKVPDRLPDSLDYGLGEYVTIDDIQIKDAWLVDSDGNRTSTINNSVEWVGQIYARRPSERFAGFELELLINSDQIIRRRAPSGVVVSSASDEVVIEETTFTNDSDADAFNVGDELKIVQPDGTVRDDSNQTVLSIDKSSGASVNDRVNITGTWTTNPVAGDYVRLADYDDYDNTTVDTYVDRVYVYLSDLTEKLGTDNDDGDIYGI